MTNDPTNFSAGRPAAESAPPDLPPPLPPASEPPPLPPPAPPAVPPPPPVPVTARPGLAQVSGRLKSAWEQTGLSAAPVPTLICISGLEKGRRHVFDQVETSFGSGPENALVSADSSIPAHLGRFVLEGSKVRFEACEGRTVAVNGIAAGAALLGEGDQILLGDSLWVYDEPGRADAVLRNVASGVSTLTGLDRIEAFSFKRLFAEVLRKRSPREIEEHLMAGTQGRIPALQEIQTSWPQPWLFVQALGLALLASFGLFILQWVFHNPKGIPGLIMLGAMAVPFAMAVFFFEMNAPKNISFLHLLYGVFLGGVASLIITLVLFKVFSFLSASMGASAAGPIEETAKLLTVLLVMRGHPEYRWTLNGVLLGGAVGVGFALYETAGYGFEVFLAPAIHKAVMIASERPDLLNSWDGLSALGYHGSIAGAPHMIDNLIARGWQAIGTHEIWTAMAAGALFRVKGDRPFSFSMLADTRFLRVFVFVILLHMTWNWGDPAVWAMFIIQTLHLPVSPGLAANTFLYLKIALLIVAGWFALLSMIQSGLNEIREAQRRERTGGAA